VEDVLIDSPCANVSNFSVSGDTFSPGFQSYGYFTNTSPDFPLASGIVLSTARAVRSEGPNDNLVDEGSVDWAGDPDLEQALNGGNTVNATVLEFDLTPYASQMSFDYVFASEEYRSDSSTTCQYSDGIAFLIRPADSPLFYYNMAVIPYTNVPVAVTTVHPEIPGGCAAINEFYFGSFNPSDHPVNFNGQTKVLTAKANVIPGTTYHIKLVIADEHNIRYDSSIFIGSGSFRVGSNIGPDRLVATNNPICFGETYTLNATEPGNNTYQWFKDGIAITGETNASYTVTEAGVYGVDVNLSDSGCIAHGQAIIEYTTLPAVQSPVVLYQCDPNDDGVALFNLTRLNEIIAQSQPGIAVTYFSSLADAQADANAIQNPLAYLSPATDVVAKATNGFGCSSYATVNLAFSNEAISGIDYPVCDEFGPLDGIATFDLQTQVSPLVLSGLPPGLVVEYYDSMSDAEAQTNPLPGNYVNESPFSQTIYARLVNGPDCFAIAAVTLIVHAFDPGFTSETLSICDASPLQLQVAPGYEGYLWSTMETTNSIWVTAAGQYTVTATDANGCTATKTFMVNQSGVATITNVAVNDFNGAQNSLSVEFSGPGQYEFSIDGIHFQSSPVFTGVLPGEYLVYIRETGGCGTPAPTTAYVMDFPHFFTPNGDGFNDVWYVKNLNMFPDACVRIFDRYGKLVYSFESDAGGWDGRMEDRALPSTDYWFVIDFRNGRTVKSHFSLKR
jgi:gliding motility-associated-like protein